MVKNGTMMLDFVAKKRDFSLFERINTGDNTAHYWVIGWLTEWTSPNSVTWANGSYFEGSPAHAFEVLCNKAK